MILSITVPGEPVAQGRGRIVKVGGFSRIADPTKSRNWKGFAQHVMGVAMIRAHLDPLPGPLDVLIRSYWLCPKSQERKRTPRPASLRPKKPDGDNVAKAVLDAGNGVLWLDDAQCVRITVEKWQAAQGEPARVEIEVRPIEEAA